MKPHLSTVIATHTAASLLGLATAWLIGGQSTPAHPPYSNNPEVFHSSRIRPPHPIRLSTAAEFREARSLLESTPGNQRDRDESLELLFKEWAAHDPAGLLAHLETCAEWPSSLGWDLFRIIARSRPDLLLDFSMRTGCRDGFRGLDGGDAETVAALIAALPPGEVGPDLRRLQQIPVPAPEPNDDDSIRKTKERLEEGDLDGFLNALATLRKGPARNDLISNLRMALDAEKPDDTTLAFILRLPEEDRDDVAHSLSCGPGEYPEARAANREWIVKLVDNGLKNSANWAVRELFIKGDPLVNAEIAAWVPTLPTTPQWAGLQQELFDQWWSHDPAAATKGLAALPPGDFRDELVAPRASRILLNPEHYPQSQLAPLLPLLESPQQRERFANWKWGDPYGDPRTEDPDFNPFADPFAEP